MRTIITSLLCLFLFQGTYAQRLPQTSLYLFEMKTVADSIYRFSNPKFLSGFNLKGYNNQPHFISDDEMLLTVQMYEDSTQTDIYKLDIRKMELARFTRTEESEFSPTLVPAPVLPDSKSRRYISTVRVEKDGFTQRLWKYPLDRSDNGEPVFRTINDIGYHFWMTPREVLLFIVGTPHRLISANTDNETSFQIASNIGRCIQRMPNGNVVFVDKTNAGSWLLKSLSKTSYYPELITATLPGSEDFIILPDGTFLMGKGTKLYKFHPGKDVRWQEAGDFSYYGFRNISRLAVRGNKMVMVAQ